jgi:hypothetical protein
MLASSSSALAASSLEYGKPVLGLNIGHKEGEKQRSKKTKISREKEGKDEICQEDYSLQRRLFKVTLREPQF